MAELSVFVVHPSEEYCQQIIKSFQDYDPELEIRALVDLRDAPNMVREEQPSVVVVGVDTANDPALKTIETICGAVEDVGIVVVSKDPTHELLVSCMRAGSDEFLQFPIKPEELGNAMAGLLKRKGISSDSHGKAVAVFSPVGGVGVTTLSCNLAAGIADALGPLNSVCLLDMNVQFGAVALAMDIREFSHTLSDAAHEVERLDENLITSMVSQHISGASVLPAPLSVGELEGMDAWNLRTVIQICRKTFRYVIMDMPHAIDDTSIVGLDEADQILVVCDMVLPTIRNVIRALEMFQELEYKRDKIKMVVNRYYESDQLSLDEIVEHVNLPVHWLVPYDSQLAITSLNSGQMLDVTDPDSEIARSVKGLARHTVGQAPSARPKKKRGLFSWSR